MVKMQHKKTKNSDPSWIGKKFSKLTVIGFSNGEKGVVIWQCQCDCGNIVNGQPSVIKGCKKHTQCRQCGARQLGDKKTSIVVGDKIGQLTVMGRTTGKLWLCKCDCGGTCEREISKIRRGKIQGCNDCSKKRNQEPRIKYGSRIRIGSKTDKLYGVHRNIIKRCGSSSAKTAKWYHDKGIRICDEWKDFSVFREWAISHGYKEGLTIDRIDPSGNYEPSNCEWVTRSENSARVSRPKILDIREAHRVESVQVDYMLGQLGMVG